MKRMAILLVASATICCSPAISEEVGVAGPTDAGWTCLEQFQNLFTLAKSAREAAYSGNGFFNKPQYWIPRVILDSPLLT